VFGELEMIGGVVVMTLFEALSHHIPEGNEGNSDELQDN
jgi:hypothetical protein